MSDNLLLQDIKSTRENKANELAKITSDFEVEKTKLEGLIKSYDKLIKELERGGTRGSPARKNIDAPLLEVFNEFQGEFGLTPNECLQHLKNKGMEIAHNTISNRLEDWEKEGKIYQVNAPAQRNRKYAVRKEQITTQETENAIS